MIDVHNCKRSVAVVKPRAPNIVSEYCTKTTWESLHTEYDIYNAGSIFWLHETWSQQESQLYRLMAVPGVYTMGNSQT